MLSVRRSGYLIAALLAGLAATCALVALAWFLSIFDGSWPEMLRDHGMRLLLQALILGPAVAVVSAMVLLDFPLPQPRTSILSFLLLIASAASSAIIVGFCVNMRDRQWDVGMGVSYRWTPPVFLLQLFMTTWGGYTFAAVAFLSLLYCAIRAFRK